MKPEQVYELVESIRKEIKADIREVEQTADKIFVKIEAFDPVRKLVYGLLGIILTGLVVAGLKLVVVQ